MKINDKNINRIKKLCKQYKVRTFSAFGSVTREDFRSDSDIDFVVDFEENDPFKYTDLYFQLKENLEKLLKRQIDLIEERGIKNQYFRKELENTKILIYGQQN
ncbi:nucleotidyltransferase domain-containing protein [Zunongwangia sp. F363]|uniref:Nucleotidyltransferase domain-containing protein n=1 Tax=Autumnicola tepida TaxID=3075595 RepID=A0ABU3CF18_9FLAO|nr:nucleotidyltransferase domain-containing protein [Zunongwangia sp. F363]MDT0644943.1 nucleotidyltransferase domain-containing protein [Zunongwangia sp. F363]